MIKKALILLLAGATLAAPGVYATVTLDIQVARLNNSSGANIPVNTTLILVADTDGFSTTTQLQSELEGVTLAVGNSIGTGGKILKVIAASDLSGGGDIGFNDNSTYDLTALGLTGGAGTTGTDLAVLWFPGLTGTSATTLASGQSFGFYRSDTIDGPSGGTSSFNMPSDPGAYSIYALDTSLGGGITPSDFNAAFTIASVVPEPSHSILALIGVASLFLRRRRR